MAVTKGLEWTFDTVAREYERLRPQYPEEVYRAVFQLAPVGPSCEALEVGIGGGQATLPVLQTGCRLTAVEYGSAFAALCREKFRDYPGFSVINGKFEDVSLPADTYDLVFSASAFHWIPEEAGYRKVWSILRRGGVFARFANHTFAGKDQPQLFADIQKLYAVYMPNSRPPVEYTEEDAARRAAIAGKYGFVDMQYRMFYRKRELSGRDYARLLGTYSDHIALEEIRRHAFFDQVRQVIEAHGNVIVIRDTIDLQLARKP